MSANSSSSLSSFLHPLFFSAGSFPAENLYCYISSPSSFAFTTFYTINTLILFPLIVLVLYYIVKERQDKRSTSASTLSHSDCFTYHLVIMEVFAALRCIPYCLGIYTEDLTFIFVGGLLSSFIWYGETSFHVLTCVERYLAVVHPIIYLGLRNDRGIRIRNVSIGCIWLLCLVRTGLFILKEVFIIMDFFFLVLSLIVMSFCSLSVLSVLIRPGPGEQGSEKVDQSKQRSFYTILIILGVLILRFIASLVWTVLFVFGKNNDCLIMACIIWFCVPTILVLPLLFLYRAGTFRCCKNIL